MKKSFVALMLTAITALILTGCFQAPQAEQKQPEAKTEIVNGVKEEVVIPEPEVVPPTGKVSEFSVAGRMTNEVNWQVYEGDIVNGCSPEATPLNQQLKTAGMTMNELYSSMYNSIVVYKTLNPDKLTKAQLEAIVTPCAELGSKQILRVTDEDILWGFPSCAGGALPDEKLQPEQFKDYNDCAAIEKDLKNYLELDMKAI
jgi:hypothetical protein